MTSSGISLPKDWRYRTDHPPDQVIGSITERVRTRSSFREETNCAFISEIEPKSVEEPLLDEGWILAMEEELNQFERS